MVRNAIKSDFSVIQNGRRRLFSKKNQKKIKLHIDLKGREIRLKSDFRSSKIAAGGHFVKKSKKSCVFISNGEKCDRKFDFWSSKMAASGHFVKKIKRN